MAEKVNLASTYLEIELKNNNYLSDAFLNFLSYYIGAFSKINYHMRMAKMHKITIPIYPYEVEEYHISPIELIRQKLHLLEELFEHIDWNALPKVYLWLAHSMKMLKFSFSDDVVCKVVSESMSIIDSFPKRGIIMRMNEPSNDEVNVERRTPNNEESIITIIEDPHVSDYGLFVDLSTTFDDMGMAYNALHLYEHIMTSAWDGLNARNQIMMNGATSTIGMSWIYAVLRDGKTLSQYLDASLEFIAKSRNKEFWSSKKITDSLKIETVRTISETRTERSSSMMARSDLHAYEGAYNTDIFWYWSNRPFNILVVVDDIKHIDEVLSKMDAICSAHPLQTVPRPPNHKFKNIPVESLLTKMVQTYRIERADSFDNAKHVFNNKIENGTIYGVDCKLIVEDNDEAVERNVIVLHAVLLYNRIVKVDALKKYCNARILPYTCTDYASSLSAQYSITKYLNEITS